VGVADDDAGDRAIAAGGATYRIGIDVGGTFTDLVLINEMTGEVVVDKVPTTPADPSEGTLQGTVALLAAEHIPHKQVRFFGHGTTTATNAFLTKRGARTVLVTTKGFRDVLEFRRMDRSGILDPYDLFFALPPALVPRHRRLEVAERVGATGEVIMPLSDAEIERVVEEVASHQPEAIAVSLLFSFFHPNHEQRLGEALRARFPNVFTSLSHEVVPEMGEYERTNTVTLNAYLGPLMDGYLKRLESRLVEIGLPSPQIMQSNGGLTTSTLAREKPVSLVESGPAGGVVGALYFGQLAKRPNIIAVDMGGTSFDVAVIVNGKPESVGVKEMDGYVIRTPMVDLHSIGAGGGSIAWIDEGGVLRVGPQSAGSTPGPAAYRRGGTLPTVTDANVVLGYLDPDYFAGGKYPLDVDLARKAVMEHVARPLGKSVEEAAWGIHSIVNANMAGAMRVMVTYRGLDPRDFSLMPFGGAGSVHAARLARDLGMRSVLIPPFPGTLSAFGLAMSDITHDYARTLLRAVEAIDSAEVASIYKDLQGQARKTLTAEGIAPDKILLQAAADVRYVGQLHELTLPVDTDRLAAEGLQPTVDAFHAEHQRLYGFNVQKDPVMLTTLRLRAIGGMDRPRFSTGGSAGTTHAVKPSRKAYFGELGGFVDCPVYVRYDLRDGPGVEGPAIIEQKDTTILILPGQSVRIDSNDLLLIEDSEVE
jgi:N-methylhydantoinase A